LNSSKIKSLINNNISKEKAYNVIVKPVVTEKSTTLSENNQIVFLVNINSNKIDIKKSIEIIYGVKVSSVNVIRVKGKTKVFKGKVGKRSDYKKAIISLPKGQSIDLSLGV
jgi:large subunit ribosomal protein L23|tara:strand:+ start:957 stop:1289 length:333 start_codon:yes stop_codon:yes gene_type:complete